MFVIVHWSAVRLSLTDPQWEMTRCLYAYVGTDKHEILYIGKAAGKTLRERWNRSAKEGFWDDLERERGIRSHAVIAGTIELEKGCRLSRELLFDVESLLISRVKPWGNIQSRDSRIRRPSLRVRCEGAWPLDKQEFYDPR